MPDDPPPPVDGINLTKFGGPITFEGPTLGTIRDFLGVPVDASPERVRAMLSAGVSSGKLLPLELQVLRDEGCGSENPGTDGGKERRDEFA